MALQPLPGDGVLSGRSGVQQMAVEFVDSQLVEMLNQRQEARLIGRHVGVGRPNQEGLIALVAATVDQVGGFGVGSGDDDARNSHHVELEAGRVQALVLLVLCHKHLAALMAALLGARTLVLDVVARNADFHEAADQVANVRIAAVAGVGVGDDERSEVVSRRRGALCLGHPRAQILLVAIRGEQGAHERRRFVGHLAERVAREIGSRILARSAFGGRRPAAEVDPLDPHPLHRHPLPRRVRAKGGDALALPEELAQAVMECRRGLARHGVVGGYSATLLDHLARVIEANDPRESGAVEPVLGRGYFLLERSHDMAPCALND